MAYQSPFPSVRILVLGALSLLCHGAAHAQWLTLGDIDLEAGFHWGQRDSRLQGEHLDDDVLRFGLRFSQQGYFYDPRLVAFRYVIRPSYAALENTTTGDRDSELLNYSVVIHALRGAVLPVEATVTSSLSDSEYKATLAGDTVSRMQQHTAELRWKYEPFPMQFTATEQDYYRRSSSAFSGSTIERDDLYRRFKIQGRSSKLSLLLEHRTRDDKLEGRDNDLQYDTAKLIHKFSWGRNSLMQTRYEYQRREQEKTQTANTFSQYITVQHTEDLDSDLDYRFQNASGVLDTDTLDARYALNHYLYTNLSSSLLLHTRSRKSESEDTAERGAGVRFNYSKDFYGTRLQLGTHYRLSTIDRNATEGILETIDEPYTIPADGNLVLRDRFIDQGSVIITDSGGGFVYVEGIDYELLDFGNELLIVSVIPGGDLDTGQSVLISYEAIQNPSGEYQEKFGSYNLALKRGRFYFSHRALRTDYDLSEGFLPAGLLNRRESHTGTGYSWDTRAAGFELSAKMDSWSDSDFELTSRMLSGSANMPISQSASATLILSRQHTETRERTGTPGTETEGDELYSVFNNARLSIDWKVSGSLTIRPTVTAWQRDFEYRQNPLLSYDETIISAAVDFAYRFRRFSADLKLFYNDWDVQRTRPNPDYLRTDSGFRLSVRRSF